jgi:hypothetical protein
MNVRFQLHKAPVQIDLWRQVVTLTCLYEALALITRKPPTISAISKNHRVVAPIILLGLALHFWLS